ncbi:MAG TPA: Hpt domain-containing protein, partial [Aquabacterium sp.]|nr:Hpt domain-containing protein [Aquabacterium sp.]
RPTASPPSQQEADKSLIDTQQAHQRWGDVEAYQQSLHRFAQDNRSWLTEPHQHLAPTADPASAFATAHRLKGAAANLALLAVERAARQVEGLLSPQPDAATASAPLEALEAAWLDLRCAMQDTLAAIASMLPAPPPTRVEPSAPPPTTTDELSTWQHQAARLRSAFLRGERLDGLLQQFCQTIGPRVPALQLQALEQAVDDFDFEAAAASLDRLIQSLPTTGDEHAAR